MGVKGTEICFNVPWLFAFMALVATVFSRQNAWFVSLFIFRYLRLAAHIFSFNFLYRLAPIPKNPTICPADCTIIVPTVDPGHPRFSNNLASILLNIPDTIRIVTVGKSNLRLLEEVVAPLRRAFPRTQILCLKTDKANKRHQLALAIPAVETPVTVLVDDSVYWPSTNFLRSAIAPFESWTVGCVGTHKRVVRDTTGSALQSFMNFLGCIYLERHNFETRATNAIDGGVFVVSGRTSLFRSQILQDSYFLDSFTDERFFWGKYGPLNADDDNFITRWLIKNGWDIKIQYGGDATIETHLGTYPRFFSQVLRWTRTTWRSNPRTLFVDRSVWYRQPWCVYAVYLTSYVNFALLYDLALMFTLTRTSFYGARSMYYMAAWIFATKMVKLIAHFRRCPGDIVWIPGYLLFAYCHSLIKLYALLTFHVTTWNGRNLAAAKGEDDVKGDIKNEDVKAEKIKSDYISTKAISLKPAIKTAARKITEESDTKILPELCSHSYKPRNPYKQCRQPISTPWGSVHGSVNVSSIPANVLEPQLPTLGRFSALKNPKTRLAGGIFSTGSVFEQASGREFVPSLDESRGNVQVNEDLNRTTQVTQSSTYAKIPEGKPYLTGIEYQPSWGWGYFFRVLMWWNGTSHTGVYYEKHYPNGPQKDWWKHTEQDQSFDYFEKKNDLPEDKNYRGKIPTGTYDNKEWLRMAETGRLQSIHSYW